jgi:hypothetical protein
MAIGDPANNRVLVYSKHELATDWLQHQPPLTVYADFGFRQTLTDAAGGVFGTTVVAPTRYVNSLNLRWTQSGYHRMCCYVLPLLRNEHAR